MQFPQTPQDKSPNNPKEARASLALRVSRAASDLNPILMVLAIGLMVLNVTLYLGMSVSRESSLWSARQATSVSPPDAVSPAAFVDSQPASIVKN